MATGGGGGAQFVGGVYAELGLDERAAVDKFNKIEGIMEKVRQRAADLDAQIRAGTYAPGPELDAALVKLQHLQTIQDKLKDAQDRLASSTTVVSTAMASVQGGSSRWAQSLLQVGYAVDDLQYGFAAVQNNISQLFIGFGPAAAGAAAIVATAAGLIVRHWEGINDVIGLTESKFKSTADVIKELEATTRRTVAEFIRLKEARESAETTKKGEAAARSLPTGTPEDEARGTAFSAAIGKAGGIDEIVKAQIAANPDLLLRFRNAEDSRKVQGLEADINSPLYRRIAREGARATDADRESLRILQDQLEAARREADENTKAYLKSRIGTIKESGKAAGILGFADTLPEGMRGAFAEAARAPEKKAADAKTAKETDAEAQRLDELDAANLKAFTEARTKNRKAALERAQSLMKGEMGQQAIAGTLQERDVRDALERAGVAPDVAARRAGDVRDAMADIVKRQVRDRVLGKGMTPDEAAVSLMEDEEKRRKREADARFDQEKADALKAASEAMPDLAGQTERTLLHTPGAEKDVDAAVAARVQAALTAGGLGQDQAALAALLTVQDARKRLRDQAAKAAGDPFAMMDLMGGGGEPKRTSQTMDALSYARSIQAGVGGQDIGKQQLQRMDRQLTTLNQIRLLLAQRQRGVFLPAQ
jgi:hypothetical protein